MLDDAAIARLRAETPGCALTTHFNHAGASLMPQAVVSAITEHLHREAMHGPHEAAAPLMHRVEAARADAAALLGAQPDEIAFTSSGSAAWCAAFAALPPLQAGDRMLTGRQEWGGNIATMQAAAERAGATLEVIPSREDGRVDPDALAAMIDDRVKLIALTWCPANGGLINDAAAIGKIARAADIPYFIDAGQALGQLPIDVEAVGCDMLKGAGRKALRGPRGTALLYVRRSFLPKLQPIARDVLSAPLANGEGHLREDARRFETSEAPIALLLGLGEALKLARALGVDNIRARIKTMAEMTRARLADIRHVELHDLGLGERSGLVAFTVNGIDGHEVRARLGHRGVSIGANGVPYTPFDMTARGLTTIARASLSYLTNADEIEKLGREVEALAA